MQSSFKMKQIAGCTFIAPPRKNENRKLAWISPKNYTAKKSTCMLSHLGRGQYHIKTGARNRADPFAAIQKI
jgi:hypothetical protein